jgi:hypothetical protein
MKQELTPAIVFSSMAIFDYLKMYMMYMVYMTMAAIESKVSMDRIDAFLKEVCI